MAQVRDAHLIRRAHVIKAMEAIATAPDAATFVRGLGFAPAVTRILVYRGKQYPSKALVGLARSFTSYGVVANDFHGGEGRNLPVTILKNLGFETFADLAVRSSLTKTGGVDHSEETYPEGAVSKMPVNKYERDPRARTACISHYGCACQACGMDFSKVYGQRGQGFIHVHHTRQLSKAEKGYRVDPIADLIPLCPNCHSMVHLTEDMLSLPELRAILVRTKMQTG